MTENIHTAIHKVMQTVGYVKKEKSPELKYTYAGEASLIQALRPAMLENGIYMHVLEVKSMEREQYTTARGTQMINTVITGVVRFTHAMSDTHIDVMASGEGADAGDKSANKALTGLYKYALRQTFMIETGDDPDKNASEERATKSSRPEATDSEVVTDALWKAWEGLKERAAKVSVQMPNLDRAKVTAPRLKKIAQEQRAFIEQAEEQAKAGE